MPEAFNNARPAPLRPQWTDTQGLVLSAYPRLEEAAYVLYRITQPDLARKWLAGLLPKVTTAFRHAPNRRAGHDNPRNVNINIAFTATGIDMLGVQMSNFSNEFVDGMVGQDHRSRMLGDVGKSDPAHWEWGNDDRAVDVLLMVFADKHDWLVAEIDALAPLEAGLEQVSRIYSSPLLAMKEREHFGFVDGKSQPILAGSTDAERFPDSIHLTALGEFVLGYPNAFGIALGEPDRAGRTAQLPSAGPNDANAAAGGAKVRGKVQQTRNPLPWTRFGKNGTYLVLRQLEQHVDRFRAFIKTTSGGHELGEPEAEYLAAKIVGRWRDGTPLVPYATLYDNEFGFAEDPHGYGCPLGSHVRRANPRDTFENNAQSFRPRNEHRILRRGRSYGPPFEEQTKDKERGLMFLCLNADLERQFEFIQQNWINNPAFAGLAHETDPLVSPDGEGRKVFTMGGLPAPQCVHDLPRFVTVRGGQYFFLPGMEALTRLAGL